jgi:hypothetical protein
MARAKHAIISFCQQTISRETEALAEKFALREARLRELNEALLNRLDDACRALVVLDDRVEDVDGRVGNVEDKLHATAELESGVLRRVAVVEQRCSRAEGSAAAVATRLQRDVEGYREEARTLATALPAALPLDSNGVGAGGVTREDFFALQEHIQTVDSSVQQFSEQLCADVEAWQGSMRQSLCVCCGREKTRARHRPPLFFFLCQLTPLAAGKQCLAR